MIERFFLPNGFMCAQPLIHDVRGCAFDDFHDFGQWEHALTSFVDQRRENQMDVIWHDHDHPKVVPLLVIVPAAIEDDLPRPVGQNAAILRDKRDEMRLIVPLQMRQVSAVESHQDILTPQAVYLAVEVKKIRGLVPK